MGKRSTLLLMVLLLPRLLLAERDTVRALYVPLADHYAAILAYEMYRDEMVYADFQIEKMESWDLLRARFYEEQTEMAFVMAPLAVSMFQQKPYFKWIGLMHRNGSALAVNRIISSQLEIPVHRRHRKPTGELASLFRWFAVKEKYAVEVGVPHLLSTHSVVLFKYLRDYGITLSTSGTTPISEVSTIAISPPRSPAFLKGRSNLTKPAAFEQSLPWADVCETGGKGVVAWYSKDVLQWPQGHVECIALATNTAIRTRKKAVQEVMFYIRKAGRYIETHRELGGSAMDLLVSHIRKHIPEHSREAILASLDSELDVISYRDLTVDKAGLLQVVNLALEAGILRDSLDIDSFCDDSFDTFPGENDE